MFFRPIIIKKSYCHVFMNTMEELQLHFSYGCFCHNSYKWQLKTLYKSMGNFSVVDNHTFFLKEKKKKKRLNFPDWPAKIIENESPFLQPFYSFWGERPILSKMVVSHELHEYGNISSRDGLHSLVQQLLGKSAIQGLLCTCFQCRKKSIIWYEE